MEKYIMEIIKIKLSK